MQENIDKKLENQHVFNGRTEFLVTHMFFVTLLKSYLNVTGIIVQV